MTKPQANEPRQWWVDIVQPDERRVCGELYSEPVHTDLIHVIEFSAYERLKEENQRLLDVINNDRSISEIFTPIRKERDQLRAEVLHLMQEKADWRLENAELSAEVERLKLYEIAGHEVMHAEMKAEISRLQRELEYAKKEIEEFKSDYKGYWKIKHDMVKAELEDAKGDIERLEQTRARWQMDWVKACEECDRLKAEVARLHHLDLQLAHVTLERDGLEKIAERYRDKLKEAVKLLSDSLKNGTSQVDPLVEDLVLEAERRGALGALMHRASRAWRESLVKKGYPVGGEFTVGHCYSTVENFVKEARQALQEGEK